MRRHHGLHKDFIMLKYLIYEIFFVFVVLLFIKNEKKRMQRQIPTTPQVFTSNALTDMAHAAEIDHTADFDML